MNSLFSESRHYTLYRFLQPRLCTLRFLAPPQVQLLDQNVVTELRTRSDADCAHLMSSSPILHCQSQGAPLLKPLTLTLPCPPNHTSRPQRPASSVQRKPERADTSGSGGGGDGGSGGDQRPATARPFFAVPKKTGEGCEMSFAKGLHRLSDSVIRLCLIQSVAMGTDS